MRFCCCNLSETSAHIYYGFIKITKATKIICKTKTKTTTTIIKAIIIELPHVFTQIILLIHFNAEFA